jgi:hypothetical protein
MEDEYVKYHRGMGCVKDSLVEFRNARTQDMPHFITCQWFYQRHVHENKYLHAMDLAGLIVYYDVTDLDCVRDADNVIDGVRYPLKISGYDLLGL